MKCWWADVSPVILIVTGAKVLPRQRRFGRPPEYSDPTRYSTNLLPIAFPCREMFLLHPPILNLPKIALCKGIFWILAFLRQSRPHNICSEECYCRCKISLRLLPGGSRNLWKFSEGRILDAFEKEFAECSFCFTFCICHIVDIEIFCFTPSTPACSWHFANIVPFCNV